MSDDTLLLITAAVDGELSEREMRQIAQVLDASIEARGLYEKLKADRDRLRALPTVPPPANLIARVMARIASLTPTPIAVPARRPEPIAPRKTPAWIPVAIAASLLFGIAGSSFWFFTRDNGNASIARNEHRPPTATNQGANDSNRAASAGHSLPSAPMPSERGGDGYAKKELPVLPHPDAVAIAPQPRVPDRDLFGAHPRMDLPRFDLVEVRLPFLKPLSDFDRDDVRLQLTEELGQDPAFRIDLFTRNLTRGVELFQSAARASGLAVHADTATLNFLKKGQLGAVAVYTDSFTARQLTALFTRLNAQDAKVSPHLFDMLHAAPIGREDEIEVRRVLGVDPGLFKRSLPERRTKEGEVGKSVSAGTADQIVKSIGSGKGKPSVNSAVLMTWSPVAGRTPPPMSAELKSYLSKRGDRRPNAVPVIIVIRHGNG